MTQTVTYEQMLGIVAGLGPPASGRHRRITWCVPGAALWGLVSRSCRPHRDLSRGPTAGGSDRNRRARHLHDGRWAREGGYPFDASRLVLPPSGHFDQVAAFICTELIRQGALVDLPGTFHRKTNRSSHWPSSNWP